MGVAMRVNLFRPVRPSAMDVSPCVSGSTFFPFVSMSVQLWPGTTSVKASGTI
jgi:hypothetical protein